MQQQFVGLTMPVFTAFGWAGEEQALNFALSQLEQFIVSLHASLPRRVQNHLPFYGMNRESQVVYLSADQDPEKEIYITFVARPLSLEMQLAVSDEMAVNRALKAADSTPQRWRELMQSLEGEWTLHLKQMQVDEDSGERSSYQDLFKDTVETMDAETAESVSSRAAFLHGEPQWVVPLTLSRRFPAEQVAAMGTDVVRVMSEQVREMVPLLEFMTGRVTKAAPKKSRKEKAPRAQRREETMDPDTQFIYVTSLKPLHIRRGFVNLTPEHWEFFAQSARATTRDVTVKFDDRIDSNSSVWHLASSNMARLVLSDAARYWLQETFDADDNIQVTATKVDDEEIEVILEPVE